MDLLSSLDRCNTIEISFDMEGVGYGTIRPSWSFEFSESGGVGAVEAGKVVERHGLCPGPARRFDPRHYRCQRRNTPLPGRRSRPALTLAEREEISRRIAGGYPSDAWPLNLGGFLQRSVAKLSDMAGAVGIMPRWPMMRHGRTRVAPNPVGLPFIPSYSGPLLIN